jgi:iron complex transport system ATP-binding protein
MLIAEGLGFDSEARVLLDDASMQLARGEVLAVLGPNGAGKSTLLRLLARESTPSRGRIALDGRPLAEWSAIELARHRAVLPQSESLRFAFAARDVVALGRHPWNPVSSPREKDIVAQAMQVAGVQHLAARTYTRLSAGERARVQLARVLAQIWEAPEGRTRYLLLDEPTANLDLAHQHEIMAALRHFAASGVAVMIVLHDLNLASEYADRALLLKQGRIHAAGPVRDVLDAQHIADVFDVDVELLPRADGRRPWIAPKPRQPPLR